MWNASRCNLAYGKISSDLLTELYNTINLPKIGDNCEDMF